MSKLITNTIRHTGGSADNITLDNSQNVTLEGNATVDGTSTLTGNVGIGTSTITGASGHSNLFLGGTANIYAETSAQVNASLSISQNAHVDSDGSWEYIVTDEASNMYMYAGATVFRYAASGTAGNDISWSESMRLDSSGKMCVGGTWAGYESPLTVGSGTGTHKITIYSGNDSTGGINFADGTGGADRYRGYIDYGHTDNYMWFAANNSNVQRMSPNDIVIYKDLLPSSDDARDLGASGSRFDDVYATNGSINTSDRNKKNTIVESDLGLSFVKALKPVSYKFNGKTRTHYGLISQDVEATLDGKDFAGFIKEDLKDTLYENGDELPSGKNVGDVKVAAHTMYGLRYSEFIAPLVKAVQELSAEVETLKTKVAALEAG